MPETASNLIIPGQSIGQTELGRYGQVCLAKLGEPDARDDAMGKYSSIWLSRKGGGKRDTLFIFYVANDRHNIEPLDGVSILLVRITSPWFRTFDGLSTGCTLEQILRSFPGTVPTGESQTMYDEAQRGIAFEFAGRATAGSACVAIMVHPTGKMGDLDFVDRETVNNWGLNLATTENINGVLRGYGIDP